MAVTCVYSVFDDRTCEGHYEGAALDLSSILNWTRETAREVRGNDMC